MNRNAIPHIASCGIARTDIDIVLGDSLFQYFIVRTDDGITPIVINRSLKVCILIVDLSKILLQNIYTCKNTRTDIELFELDMRRSSRQSLVVIIKAYKRADREVRDKFISDHRRESERKCPVAKL